MNKMMVALVLCVSTQAFGINIDFQPSTFGQAYDVHFFEKESDYQGMLKQVDVANLLRNITVKIAPFIGKAAGVASKSVSDPEFKAIASSIEVSSKLLKKAAESKFIGKAFQSLTKKGYTVDSIQNVKPSAGSHRACLSKKGLKKPLWHKVKSNRKLYVVIYDRSTRKVVFADYVAHAYGDYTFSIGTVKNESGSESLKAGDMIQRSPENDAGRDCK